MKKLFSLDRSQYEAISFRSKYLYQDFDAVRSMLRNQKLNPEFINHLLEPKINGDNIDWYGDFDGPFLRLTELDDMFANKIRQNFSLLKSNVDSIISQLNRSKDNDSKEWGGYFVALFNLEYIILLGNPQSGEWAILWGFKFNSGNENLYQGGGDLIVPTYDNAIFEPIETQVPVDGNIEISPQSISYGNVDDVIGKETIKQSSSNHSITSVHNDVIKHKTPIGCLGRIKRWLRWISYRFWGLFWLIIYTLMIINV